MIFKNSNVLNLCFQLSIEFMILLLFFNIFFNFNNIYIHNIYYIFMMLPI